MKTSRTDFMWINVPVDLTLFIVRDKISGLQFFWSFPSKVDSKTQYVGADNAEGRVKFKHDHQINNVCVVTVGC